MRAGQLPIDEQVSHFRAALARNPTLTEVLARAAGLCLPGWYLVAGCLYQTVWNVVTGQPPEAGILDYDLAYFDDSDLSWDAEDAAIMAGREVFAGLPAPVQIRNQARVHVWYEQKFGVPCPPHESTEGAIDTFEATTACLGVRIERGGRWRIYAPHGLADVFNLVARPNPLLSPRQVYEAKTARWRRQWPDLTVLPWPRPAAVQPELATLHGESPHEVSPPASPASSGPGRLSFDTVPAVELMTGRLLLRRPLEDDAAEALAMLQDPDVVLWNPAPTVVDVETARAWCARGADWTDGTHATWHAVDRSSHRLVANCSVFSIDRDHTTAKIGYRVAPWQRRRGIGTEVVQTVARWAFAELGLARLQLEHAVANVGSCRVASNAGFVLEGILRSASLDGLGRRHDDHVHGRLPTDPVPASALRHRALRGRALGGSLSSSPGRRPPGPAATTRT